jgi:hypothetical protein
MFREKHPWDKKSRGTKYSSDKTSFGQHVPGDIMSRGTKCPWNKMY